MDTILVVDDEKKNLNAIRRIFSGPEYKLYFASSGEEAMEKVEIHSPSLVIMDVMMPGMDGIEACSRIKVKNENIMVLMLSGKSGIEDRMKGYAVLADDYIGKPYDPDELIAKVNILLRLFNAKKELADMNENLEITVQKRTGELIARERQALTGKMVQGIVHNLRGPLAVAASHAQLLSLLVDEYQSASDPAPPVNMDFITEVKTRNNKILDAIGKGSELIDTLVFQGGANPREKRRPLNLNELIQKEARFLRSEIIMHHGVELKLDLAHELPLVNGRYTDFSQVFYNLVKNACEAMAGSEKKKLTISSRHSASEIILSFSDTGPGIDPELKAMIFDPFFSTKSGADKTGSGSGLGLFICARLMSEYKAFISVRNLDPAGCEFSIQIPLQDSKEKDDLLKP